MTWLEAMKIVLETQDKKAAINSTESMWFPEDETSD